MFRGIKNMISSNKNINVRLAIWGVPGSSKTTYLTQLCYDIQQKSGNGWGIELFDQTLDFYQKNKAKIADGSFPKRNEDIVEANENIKVYQYEITRTNPDPKSKKKIKINLDFIDISGEFYNDDPSALEDLKLTIEDREITILEYFLSCHGILFFLNYTWERENSYRKTQFELLDDLFLKMKNKQRTIYQNKKKENDDKEDYSNILEPYIGFVVTKADEEEIWNSGLSDFEMVTKILGRDANFNWLHNYFYINLNKLKKQVTEDNYVARPSEDHRCQFFTVSAIGLYKDKNGEWKSPVYEETDTNSQNKNSFFNDTEPSKRPGKIPRLNKNHPKNEDTSSQYGVLGEDEEVTDIPRRKVRNVNNEGIKRIRTLKKDNIRTIPWNVIDPIDWFIQGINSCEPSTVFTIPSSQNNQT